MRVAVEFVKIAVHGQTRCITRLLHNTMPNRAIKKTHPSADRNSQPIAEGLLAQVDRQTPGLRLLEVASGSGQHAGFLAPLLPNISFQPTEYEGQYFDSIAAYAADCPTRNICAPLRVDISKQLQHWDSSTLEQVKTASYDYMLNCNMMHITHSSCSVGLFEAAGQLLKPNGKMFTYGPYAQNGKLTPQSNVDFDADLKRRNADWGIRDICELVKVAEANGLKLQKVTEMPSNNKLLTWQKS